MLKEIKKSDRKIESFKNVFQKAKAWECMGLSVSTGVCSWMSHFTALWQPTQQTRKSLNKFKPLSGSQTPESWTPELQNALHSFSINGNSTAPGSETVLLFEIVFLFRQTFLNYCPLLSVFADTLLDSLCCPSGNLICYLGSSTIRKVVRTGGPEKLLSSH